MTIAAIFIKITIFFPRMVGVMRSTEATQIAKGEYRVLRIRIIEDVLRHGQWPGGHFIDNKEAAQLQERQEKLIA